MVTPVYPPKHPDTDIDGNTYAEGVYDAIAALWAIVAGVGGGLIGSESALGLVAPHELIGSGETPVAYIGDDAGNGAAAVLDDGTFAVPLLRAVSGAMRELRLGSPTGSDGLLHEFHAEANYHWAITDEDGNVVMGVGDDNTLYLAPSPLSGQDIVALDQRNKLAAAAWRDIPMTDIQLPMADHNTIVLYGQSLAAGQETWPALSKTALFGATMLGGDVRPQEEDGTTYTQLSPTGFQPLVAKCRAAAATTVYSDAEVAALSPGDPARGESPAIGAVHVLAWLLGRRSLGAPPSFNVVCPAVSGKTIEQLSKVNGQDATNRYSRLISAVTQAHAAATGASQTHVVTAIMWMQGEYDYATTWGSTKATRAAYKAALAQLHADMVADIKSITGQTEAPLLLLYQTGATYSQDADSAGTPGLHVGMAQLDYALENPATVILAGPVYPMPDKSGHLNSNGSRWFGQCMGRAAARAIGEGRSWRPLSPLAVERVTARRLRVHFHVPTPPLQWLDALVVNTPTSFATKGIRISTAANVNVSIASVTIVADTIIDIETFADIPADGLFWIAPSAVFGGVSNIGDSENMPAYDLYSYTSGSGQYAGENIAPLVGKRYPPNNYSVAGCWPIGYSEF
ncbi:sialate O-acetylesterase [Xanthobacter autotrophicus DSM 597]|uniref:sialate O-acetylesterase n=1 Tax=Xanthobacter wiegelii TaxID=3119913 RepID=UPI0037262419